MKKVPKKRQKRGWIMDIREYLKLVRGWLSDELTATLLCITKPELLEYDNEDYRIPVDMMSRIYHLFAVTKHLSFALTEEDMRKWFFLHQSRLGGKTPAEILLRNWDSFGDNTRIVYELAAAVSGRP